MSLDEELRGGTRPGGGDARDAPRPTWTALISGGGPAGVAATWHGSVRVRRRGRARRLAAAYGVAQVDPGRPRDRSAAPASTPSPSRSEPATSRRPCRPGPDAALEPGTYRMLRGHRRRRRRDRGRPDRRRARHWESADFAGWSSEAATATAGVGVYQPDALAAGTGCSGDWYDQRRDAATRGGPGAAAGRGSRGARSSRRRRRPRRSATTPSTCGCGSTTECRAPVLPRRRDARSGDRGITYPRGHVPKEVVIDFWVVDLDGTPVVVDKWRNIDAPRELVDTATGPGSRSPSSSTSPVAATRVDR